MYDYLLNYAIDKIWCNPRQDKSFNFKLRRITPVEGSRESYVVEKERYPLPVIKASDVWHVFQLGQSVPQLLGLPTERNKWIPLAKLVNDQSMDIEVFADNGILYPRLETFVLFTEKRNLLIAIRNNSRYPALDHPDVNIYIQLYSNGYFHNPRSFGNRLKEIYCQVATKPEDVRQFQIKANDLMDETGYSGIWYVNGRLVNEINAATATTNDYLEFMIDSSIKKIIDFPINQLQSFMSTLDSVRKYILHYPGDSDVVDFFDDIDVYLYKPRNNNNNIFSGVLYHRNKGNWLRMLTHKDYSIATDTINSFVANHPLDPRYTGIGSQFPSDEWSDVQSLTIRLYIKESGTYRPVIPNAARTQELYQLSSEQILRAMTGADAVADVWRAENLEKCRYVGFMGLDDNIVFPKGYGESIQDHPNKQYVFDYAADALGYYHVGKLLSDSPVKESLDRYDNPKFALSYNFWDDATIFEYDSEGHLLGYYKHSFGEYYRPHNSECKLIEPVAGNGGTRLDAYEGKDSIVIPKGYGFRIYVMDYVEHIWRDITDSDELYDFGYLETIPGQPSVWHWVFDPYLFKGYIRLDSSFYIKKMTFNKSAGMIRFNLDCFESVNNLEVNRELIVPFGQYDVFLNNKALVENIDYVLKDNRVVISNLEYLENDNGVYNVLIRGTGFCSPEMTHYEPTDMGFVEYGVLSSDTIYQLHKNKVERIVVDGRVMHPDDVSFDEYSDQPPMTHVRNGSPFQIQRPQSAFKEVFADDYASRTKDDIIEKQVSKYLTYYLPKRTRDTVDSIDRKYKVLSCGSNLLLHLILTKRIKPIIQNGRLREDLAIESVMSYEWIKRYDITNTNYNENHIVIYPHWYDHAVGLELAEYNLYRLLLREFVSKDIELAPFIYIKEVP